MRALADRFTLNENLIEVYPKATLVALGLGTPFKKHLRERETRARILESLSAELRFGPGVWRERCIQSDHLFEAVICAFTGFLWARDGWALPATRPRATPPRACATAGSGRRPSRRRRRAEEVSRRRLTARPPKAARPARPSPESGLPSRLPSPRPSPAAQAPQLALTPALSRKREREEI